MAENTRIEWADHTFSPWWGCTKIAPACDNCYAATLATGRFGQPELWSGSRRRIKDWRGPRKWNRNAAAFLEKHGRRQRIFTASMADIFDNQVDPTWRDDFWALVRECPDVDWLLLTKRPQNIAKMLPEFWDEIKSTVWLGTTIEDQKRHDLNAPHLKKHSDAAVLFYSCEPVVGPISFDSLEGIGWIIAGGESDANRIADPAWYRDIRDQCQASGTPFHFKQWGDYDEHGVRRGKKNTGRVLDGVTHDGFPVTTGERDD